MDTAVSILLFIIFVGIVIAIIYFNVYAKNRDTSQKKVVIRTYTTAKEFEKDANAMVEKGFTIQSVSGGGKHFSGARATAGYLLAGPLGLLFSTGVNRIVVTYVRQDSAPAPEPQEGFCQFCGAPIQPGNRFCPQCGREIMDSSEKQ